MPTRVRYQHPGRRELFPVWNQFTHAPRPVTVNRVFHAFSRGEFMEFPESLSPSERRIQTAIQWLVEAWFRLLTRVFAGEIRTQNLTVAQLPEPRLE